MWIKFNIKVNTISAKLDLEEYNHVVSTAVQIMAVS